VIGNVHILLCEDQMLMRMGLRTVLELEPGFQIIGEAANGEEAFNVYKDLYLQGSTPDIVLMDVQMPRKNGVEATAAITTLHAAARVIILSTFDYEEYVFDAIKAGAMSYLLKDVPAAELTETIRKVYAGEPCMPPKIASKLLNEIRMKAQNNPHTKIVEHPDELSMREIAVLKLLAHGNSNREIAEKLVLAEGTIKNHVSNILSKLHAENRTHAANLARTRRLI
jgi:two-component system, NarL family, response regulator DegU